MKAGKRIRTRLLVRVTQVGRAVDVVNGGREVELLAVRISILGRDAGHPTAVNRALLGILTRIVLVLFTFILIVVLAQFALVAASTRAQHLGLDEIVRRAWEGTQDYFGSLLQGSLGEATSTSILGGRRRSMGEVLLDAYPKSMVLVGLAVTSASCARTTMRTKVRRTRAIRVRMPSRARFTAVG